jgi:hypothetical protein
MQDKVRSDILAILEDAASAMRDSDGMRLREISDHTLHNASIFQDTDSITIAVAVYALSKTVDRMGKTQPKVIDLLLLARKNLEKNDILGYETAIQGLIGEISQLDSRLNLYIQKVMEESEVKKGSRLYEHGISLAQTAELFGISHWELMKYIGQTKIAEKFPDDTGVVKRLEHARRLFYT